LGSVGQSRPSTLSHAHAPSRCDASRAILAHIVDEGKSGGGGGGEFGSVSLRSPVSSTGGGGLRRSGSRKSVKERAGSVAGKSDEQEWVEGSGMMSAKKADALGDVELEGVGDDDGLLETPDVSVTEALVEEMKARERKGEVY